MRGAAGNRRPYRDSYWAGADPAAILAGMARKARVVPGGWVYHVLNRSVGRMRMLRTQKDFAAFDRVILQAHERCPLRILSYCLMGNHWHFIAWPREDGQLTEFPTSTYSRCHPLSPYVTLFDDSRGG